MKGKIAKIIINQNKKNLTEAKECSSCLSLSFNHTVLRHKKNWIKKILINQNRTISSIMNTNFFFIIIGIKMSSAVSTKNLFTLLKY